MNRLQVGDEVYVRFDGNIKKCLLISTVGFFGKKPYLEFINKITLNDGCVINGLWPNKETRIVYPFPCIKELAV